MQRCTVALLQRRPPSLPPPPPPSIPQVLILLLGILIIATTDKFGIVAAAFGWIETTTYVIIGLALALVLYTLVVDALALKGGPRNRQLRARHGLMMSHNVFNLEIHSEVVPAYVAQADGEAILRLQEVEDLVIGWALRKRSPEDADKFAEWQRMAANDPSLIKGVLSPKYRARKQGRDETTLASSYVNSLLEIRQGETTQDPDSNPNPHPQSYPRPKPRP